MIPDAAIKARLAESTALVALVGTRIYSGWLPQNVTYPALAFFEVSGNEIPQAPVGRSRFQFSGFSPDLVVAKKISNAVIAAFKDYSGVYSGISILKTVYLGRVQVHETETGLFHYATDIEIIHKGE